MKRLIAVAAVAAGLYSPAIAQEDLWSGFYAGVYTDQSFANTQTKFDAGVLVGARFTPFEHVVLGAELQGGRTLNTSTTLAHAYVVGTAGAILDTNTLVYAFVGAGVESLPGAPNPTYKGGIGIEFAANELVHLRGEIYAARDSTPWQGTFYGLRGAVLFQFN